MSIYQHHAPSTTSLSDDADDIDDIDDEPQFAYCPDYQPSPAQWLNKPHRVSHPSKRTLHHSPIATIPPEVLISIFKHLHLAKDLYNALQVCRTWCECAVELLWHKPSFPKSGTVHRMAALLRSSHQTFTYARFIRRLNFLNFGADLMDDLLTVFAQCDRLERLTLIGCKNISGEVLNEILPNFSNLVAIDLTGVTSVRDSTIVSMASVAVRLQGINLSNCEHVTDISVVALASSCPLLRRVKLSNLITLTDLAISALAENCPMLLELDLNRCKLITDISVRLIWSNLAHMREMRLSHCSLLTDAAFPYPIRPDSLPDVPNPFPSSKNDDLPPLIISKAFEHLRMLDLTACSLITDNAVEGIISHAPKIRNLVLNKCPLLTDGAVESICKLGRHLHYLHLGHASKIMDRSVRLLARSCMRIRYIDFANCVHLTDMSVFELSALPKLRRIGLVRVNQLTDEAIYALAERHATLERIHLSYCDQITVMAIHFLLLKLHKLTHLSLTGVPTFRQPELQQFCREPPRDFNMAQRMAFCVFSGKGVSQLRTYLTELFDRITEVDNTDDTEYEEDDYDVEAYQEDDSPEPDQVLERPVLEEATPSIATSQSNYTPRGPYRASVAQEPPPHHEFTFQRDRTIRSNPLPDADVMDMSHSPDNNLRGATLRLNAQIQESIQPTAGVWVARSQSTATRSAANSFPVIEPSMSPPPNDHPQNSTQQRHANSMMNSGFLRTIQERPPVVLPGENRSLTPDLNYAEIGHGRGAQAASNSRSFITLARDRTPRQTSVSRLPTNQDPTVSGSSRGNSESEDDIDIRTTPQQDSAWPRRAFTVPAPSTRTLEATTITTTQDLRGRDENRVQANTSNRTRSVKRSIRNTFVAAEHYASSLLFGRSSNEIQPEPGHPPGNHGRN